MLLLLQVLRPEVQLLQHALLGRWRVHKRLRRSQRPIVLPHCVDRAAGAPTACLHVRSMLLLALRLHVPPPRV